MPTVEDEYWLEDLATDHPIGASLFVPFAIHRLRREQRATSAVMTVRLRGIMDRDETERALHLMWQPESAFSMGIGVQDRPITEWAACGVACAVMSVYTGLRVRQVAAEGDRFDYWVDDGLTEFALEVTGTLTEDLEQRHRAKVRQLLANPYGVDGFVVVVGFTTREVIVSYNRYEEDTP